MGNVLKMAKQQIIKGYVEFGWSNRAINRATGIHRDTISSYRRQFENGPKVPTDPLCPEAQNGPEVPTHFGDVQGQTGPKAFADSLPLPRTNSRLVFPHRRRIRDRFLAGLSAQRIYQDLVEEAGFNGSYEVVKRYVRKLRKRVPRFYERLPTVAGREAQIDFGKAPCRVLYNGKWRRPWLFKATLSFSRHSYEELVWKQDVETFLRCLEHAFTAFGGVPETIKLDNLKAGVLEANLYEPQLNPALLSFSKHYGFVPNPCAPRKPEHKGRVERDIGYTKDNALKGRHFETLEQGNLFLKHWNKRWARTRIHGSTRQQVWKRFVEVERPILRALPPTAFQHFRIARRKVDVHGHIGVDGCFYSVHHRYIGQELTVHYNHLWIRIFEGYTLLVQHRPLRNKGHWVSLAEHKPPYSLLSREQAEGWQCTKAKQIGPACHRMVYKILCSDHPLAIRKTRGILALAKKYDGAIVEQGCQCALSANRLTYRSVAYYCQRLAQQPPGEQAQLTQQHELIRQLDIYDNLVEKRNIS
jgi:transposase